jgi:hypothetical protein
VRGPSHSLWRIPLEILCRVDDCSRPIYLKRDPLCNAHYLQMRAGKPFTTPRNTTPVGSLTCSFEPCDRPQAAKGFCTSHYAQQRVGKELVPLYGYQRQRGTLAVMVKVAKNVFSAEDGTTKPVSGLARRTVTACVANAEIVVRTSTSLTERNSSRRES